LVELKRAAAVRSSLISLTAALFAMSCAPTLRDLPASQEFVVEEIATRSVEQLPEGELYWRVESFATLAEAEAAARSFSLAADASGRFWLFTLGYQGERTTGATFVAELGPVPRFEAAHYTLRINRARAPVGHATSVHMRPGSEAFYVLSGQLTQHTTHGVARANAGETMNGYAPGMVMQLESTGSEPLDQLVLFVVDADRPFSSQASFD
jgi:mannose-6-phosphate isomerase-like protein (cupin superfamily)